VTLLLYVVDVMDTTALTTPSGGPQSIAEHTQCTYNKQIAFLVQERRPISR